MNNAVAGAEFAHSVQLERGAIKMVAAILQREQEALVEGASERLEALASDKMEPVRQLIELAERRNRYLASRGLSPNRRGMETWLADNADPKISAAWRDVLQQTQAAQQLNQTNGAMIAARLQHNQQALTALQRAAGAASLYGPQGQTVGLTRGRPLGVV